MKSMNERLTGNVHIDGTPERDLASGVARAQGATGQVDTAAAPAEVLPVVKPRTRLPWIVESPTERYTTGITAEPDGTAVVWIRRRNEREEGIQFEGDAAYIVHACNAYPRLIQALRYVMAGAEVIATHSVNPTPANLLHNEARDVLRELGEL